MRARVVLRPCLALMLALLSCAAAAVVTRRASAATGQGGTPQWRVVDALRDTASHTYDLFAVTAPGPRDARAFRARVVQQRAARHLTMIASPQQVAAAIDSWATG